MSIIVQYKVISTWSSRFSEGLEIWNFVLFQSYTFIEVENKCLYGRYLNANTLASPYFRHYVENDFRDFSKTEI